MQLISVLFCDNIQMMFWTCVEKKTDGKDICGDNLIPTTTTMTTTKTL